MKTKSLLSALGFSSDQRVVVLHADDIGMCAASVAAYREISERGIISAASAMVPCSWFPALARLCRESRRDLDMGVHLTLTSEWANYRWRPLTGIFADGLCDGEGYFHSRAVDVQERASEQVVYSELRAQIVQAQRAGLDLSHLDTHMLTLWHPAHVAVYARLSREFELPWFIARSAPEGAFERLALDGLDDLLVFDAWGELPLDDCGTRLETAKRRLDALPAGLSYFLSHPAMETAELRDIAPDWEARVADYRLYMSDDWARTIEALGVKVIGMRVIRELMRKASAVRHDMAAGRRR